VTVSGKSRARISSSLGTSPRDLIKHVLSFVRIEHSVFALPFAYIGMYIGSGLRFDLRVFLLVTLCMVGARTCAMSCNRIIDRYIDARNPRTARREIPAGRLDMPTAVGLTVGSFLVLQVSAFLLNPLVFLLAPILIPPFVIYPYLKRWTPFAHFFLGGILGLTPLAGWLAATGSFAGWEPMILLGIAVLCWVAGFDMIYALLDVDHDREEGLHSVPADYGTDPARLVSAGLHATTVLYLMALPAFVTLSYIYLTAILVVGIILLLEHTLVKDIQTAFFRMNAVIGLIVLAGVILGGM